MPSADAASIKTSCSLNFSSHFHKITVFYLHPPLPRFNVGFGAMLCLVLRSIYCIRTCRKSTFALVTQPSSVYSNIDWGGRGGGVIVNLCYISAATCKVSLTHSRAIVSYHLQKKRARLDARFSSFFHVFCIVSYVRMHHFKDFNHPPLVGRLRFYMFRYRVRVSVNVFCFTVDVSPTAYPQFRISSHGPLFLKNVLFFIFCFLFFIFLFFIFGF